MATSKGFAEFGKRMKIRSAELEKGVEDVIKTAALAADSAIVLSTPVDTGAARANWIVSFAAPTDRVIFVDGKLSKSEASTISLAEAKKVINTWKIGKGSIFIANSLPYINRLDNGSSAQARTGMTTFGVNAAQAVLRSAKLLKEN